MPCKCVSGLLHVVYGVLMMRRDRRGIVVLCLVMLVVMSHES